MVYIQNTKKVLSWLSLTATSAASLWDEWNFLSNEVESFHCIWEVRKQKRIRFQADGLKSMIAYRFTLR